MDAFGDTVGVLLPMVMRGPFFAGAFGVGRLDLHLVVRLGLLR